MTKEIERHNSMSNLTKTELKERLEVIDELALKIFPKCKIDTGIRYARWIILNAPPTKEQLQIIMPDEYFEGKVCSNYMYVLMFMPYF